jgi:hypothetical protein
MPIIIVVFVFIIAWFVLAHLRPLTESEIIQLARKRRFRSIRATYNFLRIEVMPDLALKKSMPPSGGFIYLEQSVNHFPNVAASLLKHKKHEWTLIAFVTGKIVKSAWTNKGPSNQVTWSFLPENALLDTAKRGKCSAIMRFHNHPNPDPGTLNCSQPSQQDYVSANYYSSLLASHGIAFFDFVCERGLHYEFHRSIPDSVEPIAGLIPLVEAANGKSRTHNFLLHWERVVA